MKISKFTTKEGAFGLPVTTELETIVERMRSEKNREAVEQAVASLCGDAADRLPRLLFSGTFGRGGTDDLRTMSGLLLMDVDCPQGTTQIDEMRQRVTQVPYTVLAFAGILLLGKVLDNYALGAFIVCGALLLVLIVLWLCRKRMFRDELAHNLSGKKNYEDLVRSEELVEARLEDNSTDYLGWSSVGLRAVRILLRVLSRR